MKKILNTLLFVAFFTTSVSCQITATLPLNSYDYPNGAYLKDLDNELPFYVGTWEGVHDNKKYTFEFTIFYQHITDYGNGYYHYEDSLMGKFKVVDLMTGLTIYDNLSASSYEDYKIFLATLNSGGSFSYLDVQNCYNHIDFKLFKIAGSTNQLNYNQFEFRDFSNSLIDCPYTNQEDIPMFLPQGEFNLTKL